MPYIIVPAVVAVAAIVAVLLPPAGYRSGALELETAITVFRWAAYLGIGAMVVAVASGAMSLRRRSSLGVRVAAASLVLGFVAFWGPYAQDRTAQSLPFIHDITTDLEDPPVFDAVLPLREGMNSVEYDPEVGEQQAAAYPEIAPLRLDMPQAEAFDLALATARAEGWEIVAQDAASDRIEATDTTFWMGFKDDVVIRIRPEGSGSRIDMRSVSRVGRSDIGVNAARIAGYLERLQAGG